MAYRKTEKVLAGIAARRAALIAGAIDVIARDGLAGLTTDAIAERAELAVGLIYKYFPDKTELLAAAVQLLLERDLKALRGSVLDYSHPVERLAAALTLLGSRIGKEYRLMSVIATQAAYREPIRAELAKLIRATEAADSPAVLAAAAYGALLEVARAGRSKDLDTLTGALLRGFGLKVSKKAGAAPA
jgi:AcrR family transcriptional regulator